MRDLDDFLPLVQPFVAAAPEPTIFRHLRDAATRFCERTRLWRDCDTITTTGVDAEPISVPLDATLYEIARCFLDGRRLDPTSLDDLADERPTWRTDEVGCGGARWFVCPQPGTVQAAPRSSGTLRVETILKPSRDARTLPDFLFDLYGREIAAGAAARTLLMPDTAYANPSLGAALETDFTVALDRLTGAGLRGQQRAPVRTRARFV
jgi:hypothetical protein